MKLCKDCRHSITKGNNLLALSATCMHPQLAITVTNYYDGKSRVSHPSCQQARVIGGCDTEGKLWEPREIGFGEYA